MKPALVIVLAAVTSTAAAQPLTLEEALHTGLAQSPRLAAQGHMVDAAGEQVGRAAELPDPKLRLGIENLPVTGEDRFRYDRDFMTARAIGVTQEFPNFAKREARNLRAARMHDLEGATLAAQRALLQRDIAVTWIGLYYAGQARGAGERLAKQFDLHLDSLSSAIARGRSGAADAFMLRQAREHANDRVIEQERLVERARIMLASFLGEDARRPLASPPDTTRLAHPRAHLVERLAEHPELRTYERREALALAEVDLARSMKRPDWMLEVGYGQRRPYFDNMLTVMVGFELPWRAARRQDRDIASRLAEVEQARAMRENARRMHEAEVRAWLADFDTAQLRIERFERTLLPLARERTDASLAAYRGGRGELGALLEAERMVTETELGLVQALGERAKAWANLNYLYP